MNALEYSRGELHSGPVLLHGSISKFDIQISGIRQYRANDTKFAFLENLILAFAACFWRFASFHAVMFRWWHICKRGQQRCIDIGIGVLISRCCRVAMPLGPYASLSNTRSDSGSGCAACLGYTQPMVQDAIDRMQACMGRKGREMRRRVIGYVYTQLRCWRLHLRSRRLFERLA